MNFTDKYKAIAKKNNSFLCVGLDTDINKIPEHLKKLDDPVFDFNKNIIDATKDLVCAYKPNLAFYEAIGEKGISSLKKTIEYIPKDIPIILDAKRGDIGNTASMYAKFIFEELNGDAVTVNPYMGYDSVEPFLRYKDKGVIALCLTSNSGSKDFQYFTSEGVHLYEKVMQKFVEWKNKGASQLCAVVGATHPDELKKLREIASDIIFLIPGIGTQGGDVEKVVKNSNVSDYLGIINVSRKIIFASDGKDFANKARESAINYKEMINSFI